MNEREPMATTDAAEIEALIERIESGQVCAGDAQLVGRLLRLMLVLLSVLSGKHASLARLKRLLFGTKSERRMKAEAQEQTAQNEETDGEPRSEPSVMRPSVEPATSRERKTRPGHGRLRANAYPGAQTVRCTDPTLKSGDQCPHRSCLGHLYDTRTPQVFIRLEGHPIVEATRYEQTGPPRVCRRHCRSQRQTAL